MQTKSRGNFQHINYNNDHLLIKTADAEARVWVYSPTVIRVNISRKYDEAQPSFAVVQQPGSNLSYDESPDEVSINTGSLELRISKSPLRVNFYTPDGTLLSGDDERLAPCGKMKA